MVHVAFLFMSKVLNESLYYFFAYVVNAVVLL